MSAPLKKSFVSASQPAQTNKSKPKPRTVPISLRLTPTERARLEQRAGAMRLSDYMRSRLFAETDSLSPTFKQSKDNLGRILALLGRSELAASFRDLSYAARIGALPVDDEMCSQIKQACEDIVEIRMALMAALKKPARRL